MREFESLGQYHDLWAHIILSAPNSFRSFDGTPIDQRTALESAFSSIESGFHFIERVLKDDRQIGIARELIRMSLEAYLAGDSKRGAHTLQECEGLIWKGRRQPVKYGIEAEQRAFGEKVLYKGMIASIYPYEGSESDLGSAQKQLFQHFLMEVDASLAREAIFNPTFWSLSPDGAISRLKSKSRKQSLEFIRNGFDNGTIKASAEGSILFSGWDGLITCVLEEPDHPKIDAIGFSKKWMRTDFRFHLYDPVLTQGLDTYKFTPCP